MRLMTIIFHSGCLLITFLTNSFAQSEGDFATITTSHQINTTPGKWLPDHGLSTGFYTTKDAENVELTVTASTGTTLDSNLLLHMAIDGQHAKPSLIVFRPSRSQGESTRSFTFVMERLQPGFHVARAEWYTNVGTTAIGSRSLIVNTGHSGHRYPGPAQLAVASQPHDRSISSNSSWTLLPSMQTNIRNTTLADLRITFCAQTVVLRSHLWVQARINNQAAQPREVIFDTGDGEQGLDGSRCFVFSARDLQPGFQTVAIWWRTDRDGDGALSNSTLSVAALPRIDRLQGAGGVKSVMSSGVELVNSTSWIDFIDMRNFVNVPDGARNLAITASAEMLSDSRQGLQFRMLLDGNPIQSEFGLNQKYRRYSSESFTFALVDPPTGTHEVNLQFRSPDGNWAQLADRQITTLTKRRTGATFSQPYVNTSGGVIMSPQVKGTRNVVAICLDAVNGTTMPTLQDVRSMMLGPSPSPSGSVSDWFEKNSLGRMDLNIEILGCGGETGTYFSPQDHQGRWYWDTGNFEQSYIDAVRAASHDFDFSRFDINGDKRISGSELAILIIKPNLPEDRAIPGYRRVFSLNLQGLTDFDVVEIYTNPPIESKRPDYVGVVAHELMHVVVNAGDMYDGNRGFYFQANSQSMMDQHARDYPPLDPFHKLKLGWLNPRVVASTTLSPIGTTRDFELKSVQNTGDSLILYDPESGDNEYFIVENRYDDRELNHSDGVLVWHVVEDHLRAKNYGSKGVTESPTDSEWQSANATESWGRYAVRFLGVVQGSTLNLYFTGKTSPSIRLTAPGTTAPVTQVRISNPAGNSITRKTHRGKTTTVSISKIIPSNAGFVAKEGLIRGRMFSLNGADHMLILQKKADRGWSTVARSSNRGSKEQLRYRAPSGRYRWIVRNRPAAGRYVLRTWANR